ncbi:MAG TPA: hypothetical protein VFR23_11585 [Jiangellaceae bacterium]|nr:hypothetical protein [Jiangellaceae bacterium]
MKRPRPVLILFAVSAGIAAIVGTAGATDVLPKQLISWLIIADAVLTAVGGVLVQDLVTPLSAPVSSDGVPLVPADSTRATAVDRLVPADSLPAPRQMTPRREVAP